MPGAWDTAGMSLDWGTVPAWVSGILSAASVLLVVRVLYRDRKRDIRKQAYQIFAGVEFQQPAREGDEGGGTVILTVHNPTDAPIRMVMIEYTPFSGHWPKLVFDEFDRTYKVSDFLTPGTRQIFSNSYRAGMRVVRQKGEANFYVSIPSRELGRRLSLESTLAFYDINGRHWMVSSPIGEPKLLRDHWFTRFRQRNRKRKLAIENAPIAKALSESYEIKGAD